MHDMIDRCPTCGRLRASKAEIKEVTGAVPSVPAYMPELERTRGALKAAAALEPCLQAVNDIEKIGNELESAVALMEAKLRGAVHRLPVLALAEKPGWLESVSEIMARAHERPELDVPGRSVLERTEILIRAAVEIREDARARLEFAGRGSVEVIWVSDVRLRWLVQPTRLPWPGLKVIAFRAATSGSTRLNATVFWSANTLLSHFRDAVDGTEKDAKRTRP